MEQKDGGATPSSKIQIIMTTVQSGLEKLMGLESTKVPLKKISPQTVAKIIITSVGVRAREKFGQERFDNHLSIVTILSNMEYPLSEGDDPMEKYPQECPKVRLALSELVKNGHLKVEQQEKPDSYHQTLYYTVTNENGLRKVASSA